MNNIWYETVEASERLTQGDLILDCPLVNWSAEPLQLENTDNIVEICAITQLLRKSASAQAVLRLTSDSTD